MARYFMTLAFRGAGYHGWQSQPGVVTVQSAIENAMGLLLHRSVAITGAGRTDTGVNARHMVAHFDMDESEADPAALMRSLNSMLGPDIAIYDIRRVHDTAHARFDATSRTYHYYATDIKSPFDYPLAWKAPAKFDYDAMNRAASLLLDTEDFTSFAKLHSDTKTNICRVTRAEWIADGPTRHVFVITADRFLRNMVRAVVGTLADVGRGKLSIDEFRRIIDRRDRCAAGTSMPPHALFLWDVTYDYI
ncbi:MAG: tRNA pseudouridine(38-40) synthase TruA [Lachnoclostridium sp.]|nr:tRNA pseudouridine(38-40) synthase TruA [Lachnoclostridium sp.]